MQQRRKTIFLALVATVVALNLFLVGLLTVALGEAKLRKEAEVRTTVDNLPGCWTRTCRPRSVGSTILCAKCNSTWSVPCAIGRRWTMRRWWRR